ncbi:MAG: glycosyltransferase [Candidatus Micrarchaeota archaeon]
MRISIVIPTLNEANYVDVTLFHARRLNPYEIIVADSHSEDGTVKIARKYGAKVVYAKRGTASYGRNAGAKAAKGDVILFLDADSIVFPNLLEVLKKDFSNEKVVGWTCLIHGFTPSWRQISIYNLSNDICEFLTNHLKTPHSPGVVIAVRRKAFESAGGFDERLRVMEDHDFTMRVGRLGHFKFSKETCVYTSTRRISKFGAPDFIKKFSKVYLHYVLDKRALRKNMHKIKYEPIR